MSDIIEWVLEMEVRAGAGDRFQPLIEEMAAATRADEPGALHYEYFITDDRSHVTVIERYADSEAALVHLGNFGAKFAERFFGVFAPMRFTIYGPSSDELRAAVAGLDATHQARIAGFSR